jgi:hypothetical protein
MGWAEDRVQEYRSGQDASWLERRMLEHANRVYFTLTLAAGAGLGFGLWMHDWRAISGAALLTLFGHVYCKTSKPGRTPLEPVVSTDTEGRRLSTRHHTESGRRRAGSLVRALSWYGSVGRARRAALLEDHGDAHVHDDRRRNTG